MNKRKLNGYFTLSLSIITEVFATTMLKMSEGFTILLPSIAVVLGYGISFYCLSLCLKTLPLSLAYAIWSGVGTALTALIGVIIWDEVITVIKIIGILFIIGGIVVLNHSNEDKEKVKETN